MSGRAKASYPQEARVTTDVGQRNELAGRQSFALARAAQVDQGEKGPRIFCTPAENIARTPMASALARKLRETTRAARATQETALRMGEYRTERSPKVRLLSGRRWAEALRPPPPPVPSQVRQLGRKPVLHRSAQHRTLPLAGRLKSVIRHSRKAVERRSSEQPIALNRKQATALRPCARTHPRRSVLTLIEPECSSSPPVPIRLCEQVAHAWTN